MGSENSEMNAFRPGQTPDMSTHSRLRDVRSQALGSMCTLSLKAGNPSLSLAQRCKGYGKGGLGFSRQAFPVCKNHLQFSLSIPELMAHQYSWSNLGSNLQRQDISHAHSKHTAVSLYIPRCQLILNTRFQVP